MHARRFVTEDVLWCTVPFGRVVSEYATTALWLDGARVAIGFGIQMSALTILARYINSGMERALCTSLRDFFARLLSGVIA